MDGWMDGRMDGWMDGWSDEWMGARGLRREGGTVYLVGLAVREAIVRREDTHARATPGQG